MVPGEDRDHTGLSSTGTHVSAQPRCPSNEPAVAPASCHTCADSFVQDSFSGPYRQGLVRSSSPPPHAANRGFHPLVPAEETMAKKLRDIPRGSLGVRREMLATNAPRCSGRGDTGGKVKSRKTPAIPIALSRTKKEESSPKEALTFSRGIGHEDGGTN